MALKGVVFDFNGTLFWDTHLHNQAWDIFLSKEGIRLSDGEKNEKIHGRNNKDIFNIVFPKQLSGEELIKLSEEKEKIYQALCLQTEMKLAPGAEEFLKFLASAKIPRTIATASTIENVDFYFEHLKLDIYFDYAKVVFNDGNILSKPSPEIFLKAINNLEITAKEILLFEDSIAGVQAAKNAGVGKIIIVDSHDEDLSKWNYRKIKNFSEVDRNIFN